MIIIIIDLFQVTTVDIIMICEPFKWIGRCLLLPKYFCLAYDYAGKADLSKGY